MNKKMATGTTIEYMFDRRIHYLLSEGAHLENLNGEHTGFLQDFELTKLIKGDELIRVVGELDGENGFNTFPHEKKSPKYVEFFFTEEAGYIKDTEMNKYPFSNKEKITIKLIRKDYKLPLTKKERLTIIIRTGD